MTLTLMQSTDDPRVVNKNPVTFSTFTGTLRQDCSIIDPVITIQVNQESLNLALINYAYIPEFYRYYFINEIRVVRQNLWELHLHCDVLKSFAGQIRALPAMVSRRDAASGLVPDDSVVMYADREITTINFPTSLPTPTYILAMIGKTGEVE